MRSVKVHLAGARASLYSPHTRGLWRRILLDAVLGQLVYPTHPELPGLLAEACSDDGGRSWNLLLREGLHFHNGRPASAADLEYSLLNVLLSRYPNPDQAPFLAISGAESLSPGAPICSGCLRGLKIVDTLTLRVELREADQGFSRRLDVSSCSLAPMEELEPPGTGLSGPSPGGGSHLCWKRFPVGAGPYQVLSAENDGSRLLLEAVTRTYEQCPEQIVLSTGPYPGDVDFAYGYDGNPDPTRLRKVTLDVTASMTGIYFDYLHPLARDLRFRSAVASALHLETILAAAPEYPPAYGILPSRFRGGAFAAPRTSAPMEAALKFRGLFAEHGIHGPLPMPIGSQYGEEPIPAWMTLVQEQLAGAGCPVELLARPFFEPLSDGTGERAPFYICGYIPSVPGAAEVFGAFREGIGWVARLDERDEVYSGLLDELGHAAGMGESERHLKLLEDRFRDQCYALPLFEKPVTYWIDPGRMLALNEEYQGIIPLLQKFTVAES